MLLYELRRLTHPGCRVCAEYNVAETNLWILTSRLVYCFDLAEDPVGSHNSSPVCPYLC